MVSASPLIGVTIDGKYRVERVLGQGGMGVVVAARHLRLGQLVAIKFPLSTVKLRDDAVERLLREARAAMCIRSEHVAKVYDVGLHEQAGPFLVMEYLAGRDLGAVLAQDGPLGMDAAIEYVLQACNALAEAHARGIVHRDLKPSNLFLSHRSDGGPLIKVIDFGVAKALRDDEQVALTQSGAMLGSPLFMAPEQMRGAADVDARADIWALGATLYALVVGGPPFPGKTALDVHERIKLGLPPLAHLRSEIGAAVEKAVLGCLKVDPAERHRSVADFADTLAAAAPGPAATYAARVRRIWENSIDTGNENADVERFDRASAAPVPASEQPTAGPLGASWNDGASPHPRGHDQSLKAGAIVAVLIVAALATIGAVAGLARGPGTTEAAGTPGARLDTKLTLASDLDAIDSDAENADVGPSAAPVPTPPRRLPGQPRGTAPARIGPSVRSMKGQPSVHPATPMGSLTRPRPDPLAEPD